MNRHTWRGRPIRNRPILIFATIIALLWQVPLTPLSSAQEPGAQNAQAAGEEAKPRTKSYLKWMFEANGVTYSLVFLGLSFTCVALFVMNLLTVRRDNICPTGLVEEFERLLDEKQYQAAYELAARDETVLGKVLATGMGRMGDGYEDAVESMTETLEEEQVTIEQRLSYVALIGTISPMVGLFGTVDGMIRSFSVIATSTSTPQASELADGISTALFTTLEGLLIAIPAIAAFNILKNRATKLLIHTGSISELLMRRFKKAAPKKAA